MLEKNVRCNHIKDLLEKKNLDYKEKLEKSKILEKQNQVNFSFVLFLFMLGPFIYAPASVGFHLIFYILARMRD